MYKATKGHMCFEALQSNGISLFSGSRYNSLIATTSWKKGTASCLELFHKMFRFVDDVFIKSSTILQLDGVGVASGGLREMIPCIARTCVAVGVDGIFMEVQNVVYTDISCPCDYSFHLKISS